MQFSDQPLSQTITQLCLDKDITHIVICPGSRNAPLTIGFTENRLFVTYSIVDERAAGFFALGISQQLQKPVAVVCTSGSAVLNFYPAVSEAFYSDIPLVVISADRPADKIDIGDGQTIRQEDVFNNHILYSANLKIGIEEQQNNEKKAHIALNTALELQGPVHINVPFDEPLYGKTEQQLVKPQLIAPRQASIDITEDLTTYANAWNKATKKMILVGVLPPDTFPDVALQTILEDPGVLLLTEATSNLHHKNAISSIDQLIAPMDDVDFQELQPEILLTFGGMIISKKIKAFLRKYPPKHHWHVDAKKAYDTYFVLSKHFKSTPERFFNTFLPFVNPVNSSYQEIGLQKRGFRLQRHAAYENVVSFTDFKVFSMLLKKLPTPSILHLSNSAAIRYAQLFNLPKGLKVFCNRGTSGIDGSTSTAVGAAVASKEQVTLITGDLSFFYDANALWNRYIPSTFRIILVNNNGGGIFRILPGDKNTETFDTFFETVHNYSAEHLCAMHQLDYQKVADTETLNSALSSFYTPGNRPKLLEIRTPRLENDTALLAYFSYLKE